MSYYDEGYDDGYADITTNGPHWPDFSVWQGKNIQQIWCQTPISPLLLAGSGVLGYFLASGSMKWISLLGGVGLAAAQVVLCHAKI